MDQATNKLTLDVSKNDNNNNEVIKLRQGDKASHSIVAKITNNGLKYDLTGLTVEFQGTKPDGNLINDDAVFSGDTVTYAINEQLTTTAGKMKAYFRIKNSDGTVIDSTSDFSIEIKKATEVNTASRPYIKSVDELLKVLKKQTDDVVNSSTERITNLQKSLDSISKLIDSSVESATDTATRNAVAKLQAQLDELLDQVRKTKSEIDDKAKIADQLVDNINSDKSKSYEILTKFKSDIDKQLSDLIQKSNDAINEFNTNGQKAIDSLTKNADATVKKAIADNQEGFNKAKTDADNLVKHLNDLQSTAEATVQDLTTKSEKAVEQIDADKQEKLDAIDQEWSTKRDEVDEKVLTWQGMITDAVDKIPDALEQTKDELQAVIDKNKNINLDNYYTKKEVDEKVKDAGKVQTVNGNSPDPMGNVSIVTPMVTSYDFENNKPGDSMPIAAGKTNYLHPGALSKLHDYVENKVKDVATNDNVVNSIATKYLFYNETTEKFSLIESPAAKGVVSQYAATDAAVNELNNIQDALKEHQIKNIKFNGTVADVSADGVVNITPDNIGAIKGAQWLVPNDIAYEFEQAPIKNGSVDLTNFADYIQGLIRQEFTPRINGLRALLKNPINSSDVKTVVHMTKAQYEALTTKDAHTMYLVDEEG